MHGPVFAHKIVLTVVELDARHNGVNRGWTVVSIFEHALLGAYDHGDCAHMGRHAVVPIEAFDLLGAIELL
jgi:hypothetical protein